MANLSDEQKADFKRRIEGSQNRIKHISSFTLDTPTDKANQAAAIAKHTRWIKEWEAKLSEKSK